MSMDFPGKNVINSSRSGLWPQIKYIYIYGIQVQAMDFNIFKLELQGPHSSLVLAPVESEGNLF